MATREDQILNDAMTATEKEIAAGAWDVNDTGEAGDPSGDRSLETMGEGLEGQHEPDDDDEEDGEQPDSESEEEGEDEADGEDADKEAEGEKPESAKPAPKPEAEAPTRERVPGHRLREQTQRAEAAEAKSAKLEADAATQGAQVKALSDTLAQLQRDLADLRRAPPQPKAAEPAKPETPPDFFENPDGYFEHKAKPLLTHIEALQQEIRNTRFQTSLEMAHTRHGDLFTKAFEASQNLNPQNPEDLETGRRIFQAPNPGEALVTWFKRNETLREVGDNPAAFKERVAKETRESLMKDPDFRKLIFEEMRAEATGANGGRPRHELRLPPSLSGAAGRGTSRDVVTLDGSDQAVADSAWR